MEEQKQGTVRLLSGITAREALAILDERSQPFRRLMAFYRAAIMEVETKFNVLNAELSLQYERNPIETIKTRLKSINSIMDKLQRKNLPLTIEAVEQNIFDVAGIRVICSFPEDIYLLAEALLRQDDIVLLERKDYIQNPKESGYRSLHLLVETPIFLMHEKRPMKVEVQLRTIAMDFWASLEHKLRYKKQMPADAEAIGEELRICAQISAKLDNRMQAVRKRIEAEME